MYFCQFVLFSNEMHATSNINPPQEIEEYKSVTMKDFNKDDFVSVPPKPTTVSILWK